MKNVKSIGMLGIVLFVLSACGPSEISVPSETPVLVLPSATSPPPPTSTILPVDTQEPVSFPFSERGPYWTGNRTYTFVDESRNGRNIEIQIYYPAIKQSNDSGGTITRNAVADMSGAPYPLILTGTNSGDYLFKSHLASYGFVMAIVQFPDSNVDYEFQQTDYLFDFLFVLDQIGHNSLDGLIGVIDSDNTGVTGFSGDGFISLIVSGVRIYPDYYLSFCEHPPTVEPALSEWYIIYSCALAKKWDSFVVHIGAEFLESDDELWRPVTDERIRAVMPMAVDGAWLYGEEGLAAANRPTLIISPTADQYIPYDFETVFIFEQLGSPEKFMISFIGKDHDMPFESVPADRMKHFAVAFFGYYLQGHEEYADYFSEDFVSQVDDLAWGVYKK